MSLDHLSDISTQTYVQFASISILVYDHILTFSAEVSHIWPQPFSSHTVLFFLNRYVGLVSNTGASVLVFLSTNTTEELQIRHSYPRGFGDSEPVHYCRNSPFTYFCSVLYFPQHQNRGLQPRCCIGSCPQLGSGWPETYPHTRRTWLFSLDSTENRRPSRDRMGGSGTI
ncbi:hypothetical protein BGW80DRAFT_203615 [Lactifluus volemus]|nr:hypothetical protein BGW80DRAFT_203615 [Lactifluus volemus]